ncbi:hypothetical protein COW99_03280 [Candidatus Roizmanbacteria bacterium CG22_combo_CG10-13_8_21_14_all_38_20]|uniref:Uncharacterized protein n=1 Tax=Candidatus Roizmanbacteria bacterium CG22_combo_CG10-13_8_21_14_all_38_20 TaxID=1974862 RepID=A0A2H0BVC8_9BACT|nr:MAG: hypothetical protein COW99_03280 [Candidatus Roizmanbacteria bacterium CG22_combo_CG10-13_8_21_14_all_38_20]PJC31546.1 MAG: hypothetical protein CO050_03120 [Candidatus Roizmanbacteria bacterium CG_4_9_14_0_2_um_filter_38_17]
MEQHTVLKKTLEQIEMIGPNLNWMMRDLRNMRVNFINNGVDIDEILVNKDGLIKELWKVGKAHELFNKGLLNIDGSLTGKAFDYLDRQKNGEVPSGIALGDMAIEFSVHKIKQG